MNDWEWEDEEDRPPPTYDRAGFYVMRDNCSTCIFRPGNLMNLNEGRLKELTDSTDRDDTNVICHQTLDDEVGAVCKGSADRRPGQALQIAQRLGLVVEREPAAKVAIGETR